MDDAQVDRFTDSPYGLVLWRGKWGRATGGADCFVGDDFGNQLTAKRFGWDTWLVVLCFDEQQRGADAEVALDQDFDQCLCHRWAFQQHDTVEPSLRGIFPDRTNPDDYGIGGSLFFRRRNWKYRSRFIRKRQHRGR